MQAIQSRIRQEMAGNLETGIKTGKKSAKRRQKQYDDYLEQLNTRRRNIPYRKSGF